MNFYDNVKYLEFKVISFKKDGTPDKKEPTERDHVVITERDAHINNQMAVNTKLWYELAPVEKKETKKDK